MPAIVLPLMVVHGLLRDPFPFFDAVFERDDLGRETVSQEADRTLLAGVQPAGYNVLKMLPEGAQLDGAYVVHADSRLHVATADNGKVCGRQTFLRRPDGSVWKCWKEQKWNPHSGIGRWIFTRYVDLDGRIT